MKRFKDWYNPKGYTNGEGAFNQFTDAETKRWHDRLDAMPDLVETFRLIREICAGNSSLIGTILTQQEMMNNRMMRQENAVRELSMDVNVLGNKVEKLIDLVTIQFLDRGEKCEPT